jgi:hypothetical protein
MATEQLDVLEFNFSTQKLDGTMSYEYDIDATPVISGVTFYHNLPQWDRVHGPWRRLSRYNYLKSLNIFFPEIAYREDTVWVMRSIYYAKRFKHTSKRYYYYRYNEQSTMRSAWNVSKTLSLYKGIADLLIFSNEISAKDILFSKSIQDAAMFFVSAASKKYLYFKKEADRKIAIEIIKPYRKQIIESGYFYGWRLFIFKYPVLTKYFLLLFSPVLRLLKNIKHKYFTKNQ